MTPRKLYEGSPWKATFEPVNGGKDGYHAIIVMATSIQEAMLSLGEHLPLTDCKLTDISQMSWVRGVIV